MFYWSQPATRPPSSGSRCVRCASGARVQRWRVSARTCRCSPCWRGLGSRPARAARPTAPCWLQGALGCRLAAKNRDAGPGGGGSRGGRRVQGVQWHRARALPPVHPGGASHRSVSRARACLTRGMGGAAGAPHRRLLYPFTAAMKSAAGAARAHARAIPWPCAPGHCCCCACTLPGVPWGTTHAARGMWGCHVSCALVQPRHGGPPHQRNSGGWGCRAVQAALWERGSLGRGALAPCLPWARGRARVNSRARVQERRWQAGWVIFGAWQGCCCRRGGGVLARPRGVSLLASWQAPRQLARLRVAKPTQVLDRELAACLSPCLPTPPLSLIPDFTPLHARSKAPRLVNVSARAPAIAPGARVLVCAARARPRSFALPTMPWSRAASWEGARGGAMDGMTGAPRVATLGCIPDRRSPLRAPPPCRLHIIGEWRELEARSHRPPPAPPQHAGHAVGAAIARRQQLVLPGLPQRL